MNSSVSGVGSRHLFLCVLLPHRLLLYECTVFFVFGEVLNVYVSHIAASSGVCTQAEANNVISIGRRSQFNSHPGFVPMGDWIGGLTLQFVYGRRDPAYLPF